MSDQDDDNFLSEKPYSLRPISQEWVDRRAAELAINGNPNFEGALLEVVDRLLQRTSHNYDHNAQALVYTPENDGDPYVLALPLIHHTKKTRHNIEPAKGQEPKTPDFKGSNIRLDFENLIRTEYPELANKLEADAKGAYLDPKVNGLWDGFRLYHNKLTVESHPVFRQSYHKALGRYVLAKVGNNGIPVFTKTPFRHASKVVAIEEATRLAKEHSEGFGVFRCIDIVPKPPKA